MEIFLFPFMFNYDIILIQKELLLTPSALKCEIWV